MNVVVMSCTQLKSCGVVRMFASPCGCVYTVQYCTAALFSLTARSLPDKEHFVFNIGRLWRLKSKENEHSLTRYERIGDLTTAGVENKSF